MDALVAQWLAYLGTERALSENTVATYARTLRTLPDAPTADRERVEDWWRTRAHKDDGTPRPVASRLNELSAVRAFYRWCQVWEHRPDDPSVRITAPRKPTRLPRHIGRADLRTLLDSLPDDLRRATALGAYAGLRVSEAASLHWRDVDREMSRIIVRGKGDKERRVALSSLLLDHILPERAANVVTGTERAYTGHTLQMKVNAAFHGLGIEETYHSLRHRYITMAVAAGIPLTSVARAAGHASTTTTALYVSASDSDLDLIAEAATH